MTQARPRRLGRPPAVDSAETRERILVAARRRFAADGYDATTNKDIASAAGVTTGALYHYVDSKAALYAEVFTDVMEQVYGQFEKALVHPTLSERLAGVLDAAVALNKEDPSLAGFVVGVAAEAERHPELSELLAPLRGRSSRFLSQLVHDAVGNGELAPDVDPKALADLLNALLSGLARFSNVTGDAARHEAAVSVLKRVIDGTLMVSPGGPAPRGAPSATGRRVSARSPRPHARHPS